MGLRSRAPVEESEVALQVRRELEAGGYRVEYWAAPPGAVLQGCETGASGLLFVDRGEATLDVDGRVLEIGAGDRILVPGGAGYTLRNLGPGMLAWLAASRRSPRSTALR